MIIAITETWCKDSIGDAEICLQNYVLYRCDRRNTTGGGVLLYIHDSLQSVSCTPLNDLNINEAVWCTIQLRNNNKMLVGVVYRSPNSSFENSLEIINLISSLSEYVGYSHCLLVGDFNFPYINLTTLTAFEGNQSLFARFLSACEDGFLTQHVIKPTRHRHGQDSSLLDLIFTSDPEMIEDSIINHLSPLGSSDHEVLLWNIICYLDITNDNLGRKKRNYVNTNDNYTSNE